LYEDQKYFVETSARDSNTVMENLLSSQSPINMEIENEVTTVRVERLSDRKPPRPFNAMTNSS